jgi:hypothetical protein
MAAGHGRDTTPFVAISGSFADLCSDHCKTDRRRAACGAKPAWLPRSGARWHR